MSMHIHAWLQKIYRLILAIAPFISIWQHRGVCTLEGAHIKHAKTQKFCSAVTSHLHQDQTVRGRRFNVGLHILRDFIVDAYYSAVKDWVCCAHLNSNLYFEKLSDVSHLHLLRSLHGFPITVYHGSWEERTEYTAAVRDYLRVSDVYDSDLSTLLSLTHAKRCSELVFHILGLACLY